MSGNTRLVEYGIQNEKSDIRVHVCVKARRIYAYHTADGVNTISSAPFKKVPVFTNGIKTAEGYLVPPRSITGCQQITIGDGVWEASGILQCSEKGQQGAKGDAAVYVTKEALKQGLIHLDMSITEIDDEDLQIEGTDIYVRASVKIQVKCDYRGGPKAFGGTGNLFLQIAECNPFGIH